MKKLSSDSIFFYKKVFPAIWFGFLGLFLIIPLTLGGWDDIDIMIVAMPLIMAVFGYLVMKKLVFDLIDEVYDKGDSLVFINKGYEVMVPLKDIKNVSYQTFSNPPRVSINVRHETSLGTELSFMPPMSLIPFKKNLDIVELIDRIDRARFQ